MRWWHHYPYLFVVGVVLVERLLPVDANLFTLYRVPQWNYWSLESCESSRLALSTHQNVEVRRIYRNFLRAARADMRTQAAASVLNKYESRAKLSDYFPTSADECVTDPDCDPEDRDVAEGVRRLLGEGLLNTLFPTSFFQMALDLLKFTCNANRFQVRDLNDPQRYTSNLSPFADFLNTKFPDLYKAYRKITVLTWRLRGGQTVAELVGNADLTSAGSFNRFQFFRPDDSPYLEPIGGFPLAVIRATNKVLQVIHRLFIWGKHAANGVGATFLSNAIGLVDRQLDLQRGLLREAEEKLSGRVCQKNQTNNFGKSGAFITTPEILQLLMFSLRVLEIMRKLLEITSNVLTVVVSRFDSRELNRRFAELLEVAETPSCDIQTIRVPNRRDPGETFASVTGFFDARIAEANNWIGEIDPISDRRLQDDGFSDVGFSDALDRFETFIRGIRSVFDAFDSIVEKLEDIYLDIPPDILAFIFVDAPTILSEITNGLAVAIGPFEEVAAFMSSLVEAIPVLPAFPFGLLGEAVGAIINSIVENVFRIDLDRVGEWLSERLNLNFFDFPELDLDAIGEWFDSILESLDFDIDLGLNLTSLVPDIPLELQGYFNLSTFFDSTFGFWQGLSTTPGDAFSDFHDLLGLQLGENVISVNNHTVDSTIVSIECDDMWTPVMAEATFSHEECEESLTGLLRFPCPQNVSQCVVDVASVLRACTIPEPDELFNEHLGLPLYYVRTRYVCLRNILDYKIVPAFIDGDSQVTVEELPTLDRNVFLDNFDPDNIDMSNYSDTFIRQGYSVTDVTSNNMNCSRFDRRVFVYKTKHIDPCVNGASFPYTRQANRQGMTDLCGYKVLYDHDKFDGCNGFVVSDPKRKMANLATLQFDSSEPSLCWSDDLDECQQNGGNLAGTCGSVNVTWEFLASNLERCEVSLGEPDSFDQDRSIKFCPFFDYFGLKRRSEITSGERCDSGNTFCPYLYDDERGYEACDDDTFNVNDAYNLFNGGGVSKTLVNCGARIAFEDSLVYEEGGFVYQGPNRTWNPYDEWLSAFDELEKECADSFSFEGKIRDECNGKPICNMAETGCLPAEWTYACVSHRDLEPDTTRVYLFDDGDESHEPTIQCPIQYVTVNGIETEVLQYIEWQQVLEAHPDDLFTWIDKTSTVANDCRFSGGLGNIISNFCKMIRNPRRFPSGGRIWELDYKCKCTGGFAKDPVDGVCQVCPAGQFRPGFRRYNVTDVIGGGEIITALITEVSNATECSNCPPGSYTDMEGSEECIPCPLGFATGEHGSTECKPCPAGTHSENNETVGSTSCDYCEAGEYQDEEGQWACKLVAPGYSQPDEGEVSQLVCPSGTFSTEGDANCTKCSPGFFTPLQGTPHACFPCPPGTYAVTTGSSECVLCEQGYYAEESNSTTCSKCEDGLTTQAQGATNVSQCIPSFDAAVLKARLEAGSLPKYNLTEMEDLPDNGLANRTVTQVSIGCRLFLVDYTPGLTNETLNDTLREIANGYCNPLLNVKACRWDGGDCCPQTCEIRPLSDYSASDIQNDPEFFDTLKLTGACFWREYECRDRAALNMSVTTPECDRRRDRDRRGLSEAMSNARQEFRREYFARRSNFYARRRLDENDTVTNLVGNGVCDQELNNEENNFDDGDCCPQTCRVNDEFRSVSCTEKTFNVPFGTSCDTGYGCCDPLVLDSTFEISDVSPPVIETVPDFKVQYDRSVNYSVTLGNGESPYPPVVKDNDECFDPNTDVDLTVNEVERISSRALGTGGGGILCGGPIDKFQYIYSAEDAAGNIGEGMLTVFIVDEVPPMLECPMDVTLIASSDGNAELPLWSAYDDGQGDVDVYFTPSNESLSITDNILTGIGANDESVMLMAHADDGCGNVASCEFVSMVTRTEPPSMMPSANPSDIPSNIPSSIPSDMPSMQPSATLELEIELSSIKGSASKFFAIRRLFGVELREVRRLR